MPITFMGGVHPPELKELTRDKPIKDARLPAKVVIPLSQHTGAACKPCVEKGAQVLTGTRIGKAQGFVSVSVHSSISGVVKEISNALHPVIGRSPAVIIEGDGRDEKEELSSIQDISPAKIRDIIKEQGIVGLGGAAFPTHVKVSPPEDKAIDTFILNGAECEPYLTCDFRLMLEESKKIIKGAEVIMDALGVKRGLIGIEDNKPEAIERMRQAIIECLTPNKKMEVISLKTKYPQGAEKQLIKAIAKREVPSGGLPLDVGIVVDNVGTALSVYEAVFIGKPLYERVITVAGDAIAEPQNLRVRIGTSFKEIIEGCGGYKKRPLKLIMGGPMMGIAQYTDEVPVVKGTSGIIALSETVSYRPLASTAGEAALFHRASPYEEPFSPCLRCGRCIDACPLHLLPSEIALAVENRDFERAKGLGVLDCMECGACAYVCPSTRPIIHLIKYAKAQIAKPH